MKEIQIFSEGNPGRMGRESKPNGRKSKFKALISFAESSLINDLQRPPTAFFLLGPLPASKPPPAAQALLVCFGLFLVPFVFVSVPPVS
jgi:hypothetical protein